MKLISDWGWCLGGTESEARSAYRGGAFRRIV